MMTRLLLSLALLCPFVAKAAVPAFQDFYGTNGIIIRTNGVLGNQKVTVDGTNLVPFSKVWGTNGIIVRTNNGIVAIDGNSLVTKTNAMTWGLTNTGTFTNSGDAFFGQSMDIFDALNVRGTLNVWDSATFSNGIRIPGYNVTSNYVWTATNANGMGEWRVSQGGTGTGTNETIFGQLFGQTAILYSPGTNILSFTTGHYSNVTTNTTSIILLQDGYYYVSAGFSFTPSSLTPITNDPVLLRISTNDVTDSRFNKFQEFNTTRTAGAAQEMAWHSIASSGIGYYLSNTTFKLALATTNVGGHTGLVFNSSLTIQKVQGQGSGGSGNITVQTNGVTVGIEDTINWTIGVTGYVSGGVLNLGLSGSGAGEANYNGEFSLTNANQFGWVYGKSGVTNLLRSLRPGYGLVGTNESTNIAVAIDPSIVSTNAFNPLQFGTNAGVISLISGATATNLNILNATNRGNYTNQGTLGVLGLSTFVGGVEIPGHGATSNWVWTATNATTGRGEWRQAQGGVHTIANFVIVDPLYGSDSTGRSNRFDLPFATIGRAVQESTNFSKGAILLYAGTHDMGDFAAELPVNVSLIGLAGSGSTLIRSSRTITGLTSNSCVIAPSDNSLVQGVTIDCTARYLSFTAGLGSISNSFVQQRAGTNVVVRDVVIWSGTDAFFWDHGGIHDWKIYDSRALTSWDAFAVQTSVNTNSVFEVYNTKIEVQFGVGYTNSNGDGRAVIITRGTGKFYGCDFISVGNTNVYAFYSGRSSGSDAVTSSWAELYACRFFSKAATVGGLIEYNLLVQPFHPAYVYGYNNVLPKVNGTATYPDLEIPVNKFATNLTLRNPLIPNHNISSNYVWTATNATTGGGEWRAIPSLTNAPAGNFAIVDPILGDDSTARTNTLLLPFRSLGAAIDQATNFAVGVILLRPGLHDLTNRAAVLPNNVSLIGAGMYATTVRSTRTITGTSSNSCVIKPGNNSVVSDLTIDCFARTNSSTAGIGSISNSFASQTPFTNVLVKNVWSVSGADGFYIDHPAYHSWKLENCRSTTSWDSYSHQSTVHSNTTVEAFNCTFESLYGTAFTNSTGDGRAVFFARGIGYWYGCRFIVKGFTNCFGFYSGSISSTSATNELYACSILTETNTAASPPDDHDIVVAANHVMRIYGNNHILKTSSAGSIRYNPPLAPGTAITFSTNSTTGLITINSTATGGLGDFNPSQFDTNGGIVSIISGFFATNGSFVNFTNRGHQTNFGNVGIGGSVLINAGLTNSGTFSNAQDGFFGQSVNIADSLVVQGTLSVWDSASFSNNVDITGALSFGHAAAAGTTTLVADGSRTIRTNYLTTSTTMIVSNLGNGEIFTWILKNVGGGLVMTWPQVNETNSNVKVIPQLGTNETMRVVVTRTGTLTNFNFFPQEFILVAGSNITLNTNDAAGQVSIVSTGAGSFTNQLWVDKTGSNPGIRNDPGHPWLDLRMAISNAVPGDVINIGVGEFFDSAPITISNGITLRGINSKDTILSGTNGYQTLGPQIVPMNNVTIENLSIITREHIVNLVGVPFGWQASFNTNGFTNVLVQNVSIRGFTDAVLISQTNDTQITFRNCEFICNATNGPGGDNFVFLGTTNSYAVLKDCTLLSVGTTNATRGTELSGGIVDMDNCRIISTNRGDLAIGIQLLADTTKLKMVNCAVESLSTNTITDITSSSTNAIELIGCFMNTNRVSGYVTQYPLFVSGVAKSYGTQTTTNSSGIVTVSTGRTVETVSGVGGANTNFTLIAGDRTYYIDGGTTNVNIVAIMGYSATVQYAPTVIITNRTATSRTLSLGATTNNWINLQVYDGITAPFTITNGTALWLSTEILGTNVYYATKHMANPTN